MNTGKRVFGVFEENDIIGNYRKNDSDIDNSDLESDIVLKKSKDLSFLKEDSKKVELFDNSIWDLNQDGKKLDPLVFSNGKSQEDIVKEVVDLVKNGSKIIFIHGTCGTGKSAIALNIARQLGRASIVVPVKSLQRQYDEDYTSKMYLHKKNGLKMKIAMITGRENHDSIIMPGLSCANMDLPDNIRISDRNFDKIQEYYENNPLIKNKGEINIKKLKRISIAPSNPHWSPILSSDYELNQLKDAKKMKYKGMNGKEFIFYHRKEGCSYYDQYLAYMNSDVIIFNSAKYKIEMALDRKPETDIDIIDEADEFLDSFYNQESINLTRLSKSIRTVNLETLSAKENIDKITELIDLEERNKKALGINENKIFPIEQTHIKKILNLIIGDSEIEGEIEMDESNYSNRALEVAKIFSDFYADTYVTFKRRENDLYANLVTVNISKKFKEVVDKTKVLVLMSGTLHSEEVLRHVFGIENFKIVEAETVNQGAIDIVKTGSEIDCKYANFSSGKHTRKEYLSSLSSCLEKSKKPTLVHVNSFEDLPSELELNDLGIKNLMSKEKLKLLQENDKTGRTIRDFKNKLNEVLFTTKCSRGVDFPGDMCNSVIFTKYPNPDIRGAFWNVLKETHPDYFWEFYKDKARRDFLQRIYRAVRSRNDHAFILSPDSRVLNAVRVLQEQGL